jgi:predicted GNAT family N-acyltransferase
MTGHVRVKLADTPAEWTGAVAVRLAVFVGEQGVPLPAELDEHDRSALHAIAVLEGMSPPELKAALGPARSGVALRAAAQAGKYLPMTLSGARTGVRDTATAAPVVGTGRLLRAARGIARIGRLAVLPRWRGQGVGSRLLRLLEEAALAKAATTALVHAQVQAEPFYLARGYQAEPNGEVFLEDGIEHRRLLKPLTADL